MKESKKDRIDRMKKTNNYDIRYIDSSKVWYLDQTKYRYISVLELTGLQSKILIDYTDYESPKEFLTGTPLDETNLTWFIDEAGIFKQMPNTIFKEGLNNCKIDTLIKIKDFNELVHILDKLNYKKYIESMTKYLEEACDKVEGKTTCKKTVKEKVEKKY